jgi:cytochrome c oxidase subunit 2
VRRRSRARSRATGLAVIFTMLVPVLAGCVPAPATTEGREIENLYRIFLALGAAVGGLVFALTTFAVIRYRRRRDDDELPAQVEGSNRLEAAWTAIPVLTVLALFVATLFVLERTEARAAQPAADVAVEGFRWGWRFTYPSEGIEVAGIGMPGPEVVVPVGQPVRFRLTSPDVVHSFYVPLFLFKRDVIPGRENVFDVTVEEPGVYGGQCAEFCGIGHAAMPFTVRAVSPEEYAAWLDEQRSAGTMGSVAPPATPTTTEAGSAAASP